MPRTKTRPQTDGAPRRARTKTRSDAPPRARKSKTPAQRLKAAPPPPIPEPDLRILPVSAVDPCRFQTRTFPYERDADDPRLQELAASIRADGVLQPILVRPQGERFELAAGERRLRAARLAGLEHLPTLVRELDDRQLAEVAAVENLQRVDLPPLEAAASIRLLLDQDGWTQADVAERIGMSVATVTRLAKLADLSPAWRAVVADPEHPASRWGVRHLLVVARLAPEVQDQVLSVYDNPNHWFWQCGVAEITRTLGEYTHLLAHAPWSPKDETLLPQAGACLACPQRSSRHPGLFDDDPATPPPEDGKLPAADRCLNSACWAQKLQLWLTRREEALREEHGDALHVVADWEARQKRQDQSKVVGEYSVRPCKKSTPGAVPCLRVSGGGQVGEFFWGLVADRQDEEEQTMSVGDLRRDLHHRRRAYFFELLRERFDQVAPPTAERILALHIGLSGADLNHWNPNGLLRAHEAWQRVSDLEDGGVDEAVKRLWRPVRVRLRERIANLGHFNPDKELPSGGEGEEPAKVSVGQLVDEELERMSFLLEADLAALRAQVADELPEPEEWQGLDDSAEAPLAASTDEEATAVA